MLKSVQYNPSAPEGYVYTTYGHPKYVKHAVASVVSLQCYDEDRMALSKLDLPVYPRLQGHTSAQLDYIEDYTEHDADFEYIACKYYCDRLVYNLRGFKTDWIRDLLTKPLSFIPGKSNFLKTTPYCLRFGWYYQRQPFFEFSGRIWNQLKPNKGFSQLLDSKSSMIES